MREDKIILGMSNALTGPTSQLGIKLKQGSQIYFDRINNQGGIHGRKIELVSLDDGYEPKNTVSNTRKLIAESRVFVLFGYVGTTTSHAILPIIKRYNIPYLMPFTGADFLRHPVNNNIFNLRASYSQEARAQVDHLIKEHRLTRFALVFQADEFGLAAQRSYREALNHYKLKPIIYERFKRNSNDISKVLEKVTTEPIDAVLFVGTYQPFSRLINLTFEQGITPYFSSLSFVSSHDVFARLKYPSKVVISEVMPAPELCELKLCQQFNEEMKKNNIEQPDRVHFEGYYNAYVFAKAAEACGVSLTRHCLLKNLNAFYSLDVKNHQTPLQETYLSLTPTLKKTHTK